MTIRARPTGSRPDRAAIRETFHGRAGGVGKDVDERAGRVLAAAQRLVGVRTGSLLVSGRREYGRDADGPYVDVVFGVPGLTDYLGYHMLGTAPHVIRARRRKALRFVTAGGQVVFAQKVNHPGTRGTHFLTRALDAAR